MTWIKKLNEFKIDSTGTSQIGEDKIIDFIFTQKPPQNKWYVDIGAGHYSKMKGSVVSNTHHLRERGWTGIGFDMSNDVDQEIKKHFVTPDNIVELLCQYGVPSNIDFLSIDIDSFDLDVLIAAMEYVQPSLICTEYNSSLELGRSVKLKYEEGYVWDGTSKYGYSFTAGMNFAIKYGYQIILNHFDMNLFMLKKELLSTEEIQDIELNPRFMVFHPWNENAEWVEYNPFTKPVSL